ncbi:hypothetical protein EYC80_003596 [Monilinia laxa]|uniref:Methyltransferase domain-containing protein n=1 Tax=Monilinia laxa TaxID=61186 RepID=A0A5N6KKG5_MONLA|nr:hypothetical protein EYC80_003596 [Monilinia laxa]
MASAPEKREAEKESYPFNRNFNSSVRINYNHWLVKEASGYLLHPRIEIDKERARIADIGTGTGWATIHLHLFGFRTDLLLSIWLLELSESFQSPAKLDGFDISAAQYPPKEWLPENVEFFTHDAFKPFPQGILGTYDVVHLRFALCYVNDEDAEPLLNNLISLLKPGGFIQWFEPEPYKTAVSQPNTSKPSIAMAELRQKWIKPKPTSTYNWVEGLPQLYEKNGLSVIESHHIPQKNRHKQLWTHSNLLGLEDLTKNSMVAGTEAEGKIRAFMQLLEEEAERGISCDTPWICVLGRKSG